MSRNPKNSRADQGDGNRNRDDIHCDDPVPLIIEVRVQKRIRIPVTVAHDVVGREWSAYECVGDPHDRKHDDTE
jgi:hypothetical protein